MGKDFLDELFGEMDPLGLYDTDKDGHYDDEEIALLDEDEGDFDEDSDEDDDDDF